MLGCSWRCRTITLPFKGEKGWIVVHPHQRCGYSDSPFARKDTFLYCRVQKGVGGGGHRWLTLSKRKLSLGKGYFFVIEKYIEDVKQEEKGVPDLVESIMRPTDPAKEELRRILSKISQYRPKIIKIRVSTFWRSGKSTESRRRPTQPPRQVGFKPIMAFQTSKNPKICGFGPVSTLLETGERNDTLF